MLYIYYSSKESIQLQPELKLEISKNGFANTDENGNDHYAVVYPENRVDFFLIPIFIMMAYILKGNSILFQIKIM